MPGPKGLPAALLWAWPGKKNACGVGHPVGGPSKRREEATSFTAQPPKRRLDEPDGRRGRLDAAQPKPALAKPWRVPVDAFPVET
jgi:hypothetical protein